MLLELESLAQLDNKMAAALQGKLFRKPHQLPTYVKGVDQNVVISQNAASLADRAHQRLQLSLRQRRPARLLARLPRSSAWQLNHCSCAKRGSCNAAT